MANGKPPFEDWKRNVDRYIGQYARGLTSDDIDDWRYVLDHKEGYSAEQSARRALRNAGMVR